MRNGCHSTRNIIDFKVLFVLIVAVCLFDVTLDSIELCFCFALFSVWVCWHVCFNVFVEMRMLFAVFVFLITLLHVRDCPRTKSYQ